MTTLTQMYQGGFTATGESVFIPLRGGIDWMRIYNTSVMAASQTTAVGYEFYWQVPFSSGGLVFYKSNATNASNLAGTLPTNSFVYTNTSENVYGVINATVTAVSNAAIPVVSNSGTNGLSAGDVVRLINITGAQQLGGIDFTVGNNTLTSSTFSLDFMAQIVAGTTGSWMKINYNPIFYPRRRIITKITRGTQTVVTLSVAHDYGIGQIVRVSVSAAFGTTQINGLQGTILDVDYTNNTITLDIDSSSFTAFAWPTTSQVPFTPAEIIPMGENTGYALSQNVDILDDSTENFGRIGMTLAGGANLPGGANGDTMAWQAGTVFDNAVTALL